MATFLKDDAGSLRAEAAFFFFPLSVLQCERRQVFVTEAAMVSSKKRLVRAKVNTAGK